MPGEPAIWLSTFLHSLAGGVVPLLNLEAYLLALAALSPESHLVPVALAAAMGQMFAKCLLYRTGMRLARSRAWVGNKHIRAVAARLQRAEGGALALVFTGAAVSVPPFYPVSVAAGVLRLRFAGFLFAGSLGTFVRFAAISSVPRLWPWLASSMR